MTRFPGSSWELPRIEGPVALFSRSRGTGSPELKSTRTSWPAPWASAETSPDAVGVIDRIRHYRTRNEAYLGLAARQIDDRDPVQALDTLDRSLRVRDVADLVRYTRLMVQTAKLQRMAGNKDKARDTLARVLAEHSAVGRSDRSLVPSMLYLAKAQSQLGEVARAKATLSKAWRLARSNRRRSPYRRAGPAGFTRLSSDRRRGQGRSDADETCVGKTSIDH